MTSCVKLALKLLPLLLALAAPLFQRGGTT